MVTHPYISAALGNEHRRTMLEQAAAARLAKQARSCREPAIVPTVRISPIAWLTLITVGHL
jgi:hypothetical protein